MSIVQTTEVNTTAPQIKPHTIYFMLAPFLAWLWSFPMGGPFQEILVQAKGLDMLTIFIYFGIAHACGLFVYGWYADRFIKNAAENGKPNLQASHCFFSLIGCSLGTLLSAFSPSYLLPFVIVALGIVSTPFMFGLAICLANIFAPNKRGKILGTAILISLLLFLLLAVSPIAQLAATPLLIVTAIFPLLSLIASKRISVYLPEYILSTNPGLQPPKYYWLIFTVFIFGFYTLGGLMYFMVYPQMYLNKSNYSSYATVFYLLSLIPAGLVADKFGRKHVATIAICSTGLGYLMLIPSSAFWIQVLSSGFMQIGAATMNMFIWLSVADLVAALDKPNIIIGRILSVTVLSITLSALEMKLIPANPQNSLLWAILSAGLLFLLLPLANLLKETNPTDLEHTASNPTSDDSIPTDYTSLRSAFYEQYRLTEREKEVSSLILNGQELLTIQELLRISPNTLKTHLRNIFRKTGTNSQKELILLAWQQIEK